jgi:hypothetical protein
MIPGVGLPLWRTAVFGWLQAGIAITVLQPITAAIAAVINLFRNDLLGAICPSIREYFNLQATTSLQT